MILTTAEIYGKIYSNDIFRVGAAWSASSHRSVGSDERFYLRYDNRHIVAGARVFNSLGEDVLGVLLEDYIQPID